MSEIRRTALSTGDAALARRLPLGKVPARGLAPSRAVGAGRIELPTPSVSRKCSTTELRACPSGIRIRVNYGYYPERQEKAGPRAAVKPSHDGAPPSLTIPGEMPRLLA